MPKTQIHQYFFYNHFFGEKWQKLAPFKTTYFVTFSNYCYAVVTRKY